MSLWHKYRSNKIAWALAAGVVMLCVDHFFGVIPPFLPGQGSSGEVVATVKKLANDVRQKPVEEEAWYRAESGGEIVRGDAIYSGSLSSTEVQMKSGGILDLGEETLVVFDDVDGVTVPDVTRGKVKLQVRGDMRIALSGVMTDFSGVDSELLVVVDDTNRAAVQSVRGQVKVGRREIQSGQRVELAPNATGARQLRVQIPKVSDPIADMTLTARRKNPDAPAPKLIAKPKPTAAPTPEPTPVVIATPPPPPPEPIATPVAIATPPPTAAPTPEELKVAKNAAEYDRPLKVNEVYARKGKHGLVEKPAIKSLKQKVNLEWKGAKAEEPVVVQVAKNADFTEDVVETKATGTSAIIEQWAPGVSHWRVSRDRTNWSPPAQVAVKPILSPKADPKIVVEESKLTMGKKPVAAKLKFEDRGTKKPSGWVLQGSKTAEFAPEKTKTVWVPSAKTDVPLTKAGGYFFRVRSVARDGVVSRFSEPVSIDVREATAPMIKPIAKPVERNPNVPILASNDYEATVGDDVRVEWAKDAQAKAFEVSIQGNDGRILRTQTTTNTSMKLNSKNPGQYKLVVRSVTETGRKSEPADARIAIKPKETRQVAAVEEKKVEERPVARETTKQKSKREEDKGGSRPWYVALEGGEAGMISTEQIETAGEPAAMHMIGLNVGTDDGRNSARFGYRMKLAGANSAGETEENTKMELRYTRWFIPKWNPFRGPLKLGAIGAYESKTSARSVFYAQSYQMLKMGLGVDIGFGEKWHTGGDVFYGRWTDANQLFELNGFLAYDIARDLLLGVGYRLSIFEAGTDSSAPSGLLPYREAVGEGYSNLRFSF